MGVVTGVFQFANSSPVANGNYQWKLSSDAIQFGSTQNCIVPTIINGNLDANGNMTATFAFNDVLSTTAGAVTTYQLTVKAQNGGQVWNEGYYLTGTAANLNLIPPSGSPFIPVGAGGLGLPSGQLGDIIRFNVNGDNVWDAVNYAQQMTYISVLLGGNPVVTGPMNVGNNFVAGAGSTNVNPNLGTGTGGKYTAAASASTSPVIGFNIGQNGNNGVQGLLSFNRFTMKCSIGATINCRYWFGLTSYSNTGTANNNVTILGSTRMATDNPGCSMIGFRYSNGTDTAWQAVSQNAGGSQTVVNTGIVPDGLIHLFEMVTNVGGTAVTFLIDGAIVATITTNLPNPTVPSSNDYSTGELFFSGDNKNTNTSPILTFYGMQLSHK